MAANVATSNKCKNGKYYPSHQSLFSCLSGEGYSSHPSLQEHFPAPPLGSPGVPRPDEIHCLCGKFWVYLSSRSSSKGRCHPAEKTYFSCLYPCSLFAHNHSWGLELRFAGKFRALSSVSAPSSTQQSVTTPALLMLLHHNPSPAHTPFSHHSWARPWDTYTPTLGIATRPQQHQSLWMRRPKQRCLITSIMEVMFSPILVCLFVCLLAGWLKN